MPFPTPWVEANCESAAPVCSCDCNCSCPADNTTNVNGNTATYASPGTSVRYLNGQVRLDATDIEGSAFCSPWKHTRVYSNQLSADADIGQGYNWLVFTWPYLVSIGSGSIAVVRGTLGSLWFDPDGMGGFVGRYGAKSTLVYNSEALQYVLTLPGGVQLVFNDFTTTVNPQGLIYQQIEPGGQTTTVTSYTSSTGMVAEVQRSGTYAGATLTESFVYTYTMGNQLATLLLRRQHASGGAWEYIRQAVYSYFGTGSSFGTLGDLQSVQIQCYDTSTSAWTTIDTTAYRYWLATDTDGFAHAIKFVINPLTYARMVGAGINPLTAADSVIETYADHYYAYDPTTRRVVTASVEGGTETTTFVYTARATSTDYSYWAMKTVVTLPDSSQMIVYTNTLGQFLVVAANDGGIGAPSWIDTYEYDPEARQIKHAYPSAVISYDDKSPDLSIVLQEYSGLIEVIDYYTTSGSGAALGYVNTRSVQQGTLNTPVVLLLLVYTSVTVGGVTVYFVSTQTVYRNPDGTGAINTQLDYTFFTGTTQPQQITTTLPTVTAAQNGPNVAVQRFDVFNSFGKLIWQQDEQGFLKYRDYDLNTCAMSKMIVDVDTTMTGEFTDLPSGWTTPSGGGLNLITTYEIDNMGRVTAKTWPNGRVDYTIFNDVKYETRFYPGWNTTTNLPTGPTQVSRQDRANNYGETLTMSATPDVSSGRPSGTEAISSVQSLSRGLFNTVGQLVEQDQYFDFTGLSYSTTPYLGTAGTNYYATTYEFDERDRVVRTLTPQGTIQRTVYDFLNRVLSQWTGTNDTPASGPWSPTNNTSPSNMVQITRNVYDSGGVGDGNLTKSTQIPSGVFGSVTDRVTQMWYDWRNRVVATKSGVQASEAPNVHRPIYFVYYDNLNRVVESQRYNGDGVTITVTGGEPVAPAASRLRAQSETNYDEQGRVYQSLVYSVKPTSGAVSSTALTTNNYYDYRGNLIETINVGGLVSKSVYDGAGRMTVNYSTDGGGGTSWSAASSVASDIVLEQNETTYDANSNVIQTTLRQRFDDSTGTGGLGTPGSGIYARVYYQGFYYDLADRVTDSVNVGTNTISGTPTAWTRPGSVPSRSDTVLVNSTSYDAAGRVLDGTDPKGLVLRSLYDFAGRTTTTIEDYTGATPTDDTDKTTNFTYNSAGTTSLTAILSGGTDHQTTGWVYGVTTPSSDLDSDEIAATTEYPDPSSGNPSRGQSETITVNALGQTITLTDRNGTEHVYTYDVLGRLIRDVVNVLGSGVDGSILRRDTAYDSQGNAYLFTAYSDTGGTTIVNQVQRAFNGLGQLTIEYQEHYGAVDVDSSLYLQWTYVEMSGGANNSRLLSLTYPNGKEVDYNYKSGIDDTISRLTSMSDSSFTLEDYTYLGLGTVVQRNHDQTGVDLTYIKLTGESNGDAGDKYIGLDRFGRVVDQRWLDDTDTDVDRYQYTYDRNSNRLSRSNLTTTGLDETYDYDNLNQIADFYLDSTLTQNWVYDAVGNWQSVTTSGTIQGRRHNRLNEITTITGATTPAYDDNGNTITDDNNLSYVYDAWNMPVTVLDSDEDVLESFVYDALSRRIQEIDADSDITDIYYSAGWQNLEERLDGEVAAQYLWSPVYIDCMVYRDRSVEGTLDERFYVTQDANFNVTGIVDTTGTVQERYAYTPFGVVSYYDGSWDSLSGSEYGWIYLFQGGRLDGVSGKYNFRFRDYSPTLGRWMTNDPLQATGSTSLVTYVSNGPTVFTDSYGLQQIIPSGSYGVILNPTITNLTIAPGIAVTPEELQKFPQLGNTEPTTSSFPGGFTFRVHWLINGNVSGFIIQHIKSHWNITDCDGKPIEGDLDKKDTDFLEAWKVSNGKVLTMQRNNKTQKIEEFEGGGTDTFTSGGFDKTDCIKGTYEVKGSVKFIPNFDLKLPPWKCPGNVHAGGLPTLEPIPNWWSDIGGMTHDIEVKFSNCDKDKKPITEILRHVP